MTRKMSVIRLDCPDESNKINSTATVFCSIIIIAAIVDEMAPDTFLPLQSGAVYLSLDFIILFCLSREGLPAQ